MSELTEDVGLSPRAGKTPVAARGGMILGSLVMGHAAVHWFTTSFPVLLAELVENQGLGPVAAGALMAARFLVGGLFNLPIGYLSDTRVSWQRLFLAYTFVWFGVSYFLISMAPVYALLLVMVGLMDMGGGLWHPPAMAMMSRRFPQRRGFALALHGIGASIGDVIGPLSVGGLLVVLSWQNTMRVSLAPTIALTILYLVMLRGLGAGEGGSKLRWNEYLANVRGAMKHRPLLLAMSSMAVYNGGMVVILTFFPIHLRSTLDFGPERVGMYVALVMGMSMVSLPFLGIISDRFNRMVVLVPGLLLLTGLSPLLGWLGGWQLVLTTGIMGMFLFGIASVFSALVLDVSPGNLQATAIAAAFTVSMVTASVAPLVAGVIIDFIGTPGAFYLASGMFIAGAAILFVPSTGGRVKASSGAGTAA